MKHLIARLRMSYDSFLHHVSLKQKEFVHFGQESVSVQKMRIRDVLTIPPTTR